MSDKDLELKGKDSKSLNKTIFIPSFLVVGGATLYGLLNNDGLTKVASGFFTFSLRNFGWLYQIISIVALMFVAVLTFSKLGNIRFGGSDAKPDFPFWTWFAMTLTGGVSTGLITYAVNEPIIYFANIYGEMANTGIEAGSSMAAIFGMARSYYNWTFIPYAMYALTGVLSAYLYFNKNKPLSISASLIPIFGEKITKGIWSEIIEILSLLAIALGLASSLGAGLALLGAGVEVAYGIKQGPVIWLIFTIVIAVTFIFSSVLGLEKGISWFANLNSKIFYILLGVVFLIGPSVYILKIQTIGLGYWFQNFWVWGLDPIDVGGEALVMWWTLYDWAIWIAYAPLMGLFLATIAYGRTIREFMVVNWVLPSVFSIVWFAVWGGTALHWQAIGKVDLAQIISDKGAVAGLWAFLQNVPLAIIIIPVLMITLILSFSTNANGMTRTIASMCTRNIKHDEEPKMWLKVLWGTTISAIAFIMVAFGGGVQGVDGVKYLAAAGGFVVLFLFILQVASAIKLFFFDEKVE